MSDREKVKLNLPNSLLYRWLEVLRCPRCHERLAVEKFLPSPGLHCLACSARYPVSQDIPALIIPEREEAVAAFCQKYEALRLREGWASAVPHYYQNLPFRDLTERHPQEWQLRESSFRLVQEWIERNFKSTRLRILDLGAGSGWMSRELAANHDVLAIDPNAGPHGLAALSTAQRYFMAVQAESEYLPLAANSFDLAIANASLHYTRNVETLLEKISRVLRPGAKLIVMDSPAYPTPEAMSAAHARTQAYYAQMGVPELAENYGSLTNSIFLRQQNFAFTCLRRDFTEKLLLKKWWREKIGGPVAARFPIWIGERRLLPDEKKPSGRRRAGAVIVHQRKLLTYAFAHETRRYWRIPGGGIEPEETPELAARRELREELNVTIKIQQPFGPYLRPQNSEWYFLAETDPTQLPHDGAPAPEGSGTIQWLPLEKLADYEIRPLALKWELVEYFCNKT